MFVKLSHFLQTTSLLKPLFLRIFFGTLTVISIVAWYSLESEAEPWSILPGKQESTRFTTLGKIVDSANKGFYFQMESGIPMEHEWEDPGQYYLLVVWGIFKKIAGWGRLNPFVDPYRVELFVILLPVVLIFFTRLFSLPRWCWVVIPIFFWWAMVPKYPLGWEHIQKINGLLYLSVSTRWIKVLSGLWTFTITLQFLQWRFEHSLLQMNKKRLLQLLVMGFVLGLFVSIRKDIWVTSGLAIFSCLVLLTFLAQAAPLRKKIATVALVMALLIAGSYAYKGLICASLGIRDRSYVIKPVSRYLGRNTWHSLTASLGVVPNSYGLVWGDAETSDVIKSQPGNEKMVYGTAEYDQAARRFYFHLVTHDPGLLWRNLKFRLTNIWIDHRNGITRALALILILFFLGSYERWLGAVLLINILTGTVILIIVNHWLHYGLDLITHYRLALIIGVCVIVFKCCEKILAVLTKQSSPHQHSQALRQ